jgi:adenosylhomocysteine nucleosidase
MLVEYASEPVCETTQSEGLLDLGNELTSAILAGVDNYHRILRKQSFRCSVVLTFSFLAFAAIVHAQTAEPPRIAVISAFEPELTKLLAATDVSERRVINGRTHYLGTLAGQPVVLLLSGMSIVNATMVTQSLIDKLPVSAIVFSGIAGGVNPSLHVGDVTVPSEWGNYQEQVFARQTGAGWDSSNTAGAFTNFGMMFPRGMLVIDPNGTPDRNARRFWFAADSAAIERARAIAKLVKLDRCTKAGACLEHEPRIVVGGRGVSGPTFVDNAAYREYAWNVFHADALDMETAAVAVVAHTNRIPFIAFRSLSDLAGGGPGSNEVRTFGQLAADNSAAVVIAYLRALRPQ